MTYYKWFNNWKQNRPHERLGQAFCNDFIKMPWSDLFHCVSDERSAQMIYIYLTNHQYWPNMPPMAKDKGE